MFDYYEADPDRECQFPPDVDRACERILAEIEQQCQLSSDLSQLMMPVSM